MYLKSLRIPDWFFKQLVYISVLNDLQLDRSEDCDSLSGFFLKTKISTNWASATAKKKHQFLSVTTLLWAELLKSGREKKIVWGGLKVQITTVTRQRVYFLWLFNLLWCGRRWHVCVYVGRSVFVPNQCSLYAMPPFHLSNIPAWNIMQMSWLFKRHHVPRTDS